MQGRDVPASCDNSRLLILALGLGGCTVALMHTLVIPLLPAFAGLLDTSPAAVSWLVTSTMLAGVVLAPVLGRLGDMYGKRRVLLAAMAVMTFGSVLGAVSPGFATLVVARALQGAAFGVIPLSIAILRERLPPGRAGAGIAIISSTLGAGGAVGLPLSGCLTALVGWRGVFWVATALSLAASTFVASVVPESPTRTGGRFDLLGALGLGTALVCLLLPVSQVGSAGWGATTTIAMVAAAAVLICGWCGYELRHPRPLVNLRTSRQLPVVLTNLAAILVGVAMFTNFLLVGQRLQAPVFTGYGFGMSTMLTGLCMAPAGIGMLIFSPMSARLSAARGAHVSVLIGGFILAVANALQAMLPSIALLIAAVCIMSVGTAMCFGALPSLIMSFVPASESAAATSLNALMRTIGIATTSAVTAALLASSTKRANGTAVPAAIGYVLSYAIAAASALLAAILMLIMTGYLRRADR